MPQYQAQRWVNARAKYWTNFEAKDDDTAIAHIKTINWPAQTFGVNYDDDDVDGDALIDLLERKDEDPLFERAIIEGEAVAEAMPYSWDAISLVRQIAEIQDTDLATSMDVTDKLKSLRIKARELCGIVD